MSQTDRQTDATLPLSVLSTVG